MQKTFVGYHLKDGGTIHKYHDGNKGMSILKCSVCGSTSADGRLKYSTITTVKANLLDVRTGVTPWSDIEELEVINTLYDGFESLGEGAFFTRPGTTLGADATALLAAFGIIETQLATVQEQAFDAQGYTALGLDSNNVIAADGTIETGVYFDSFYGSGTNIDTSVGFTWDTSTYFVSDISTVDAALISISHATNVPFQYAYVTLTDRTDSADWTRGVTMRCYLSSNNGGTWTSVKWTDTTTTPLGSHSAFVTLPAAGSLLKLKFEHVAEAAAVGIGSWMVNWQYAPPSPEALLDMQNKYEGP